MRRLQHLAILTTLAFLTFGIPAAPAQEQPGPLPGVFGEVLDVRVVNIEVVVTDKEGIPVLGLGPGDFRLLVDGEEVSIDYFSEIRGGTAVELPPVPEGALAGIPALAPGSPVGTSYLVFIDEYFSIGVDRNRVVDGLIKDLPLLGGEDRMAVVAFNGQDLEMLTTWSGSIPTLERVLERAKERPARGLQRLAERRQLGIDDEFAVNRLLGFEADFATRSVVTQLSPEQRSYVVRLSEQLDRSAAAAAATLRSFAQPPGRKVMLLLSGGWPYLPTEYLLGNFDRVILDREGLEGEDLYRRLIDTANLLGYSIYPVDVPGVDRDLADASRATPPRLGAPGGSVVREQELHFTLEYLARETGGRAMLNASRVEAFERAVSDTRSYYWLGFSPDRAWDDARHQIRVEVRSPGYRVRSRSGYLDTSRGREVTMAVESALLFGNAPIAGPVEVELGEAKKSKRRTMEVPMRVSVPLDEITFLPSGEAWVSQLELRIAVVDGSGRRAEIPVVPLALQAEREPQPGERAHYETVLKLRREAHQAVVAVYDPASGRILSSNVAITP